MDKLKLLGGQLMMVNNVRLASTAAVRSASMTNTSADNNNNSNQQRAFSSTSAKDSPTVLTRVKPHIPLIKFRKGGRAASGTAPTGSSAAVGSTARGSGIDEQQLPPRYHRKPITQQEMEMIERGGPDRM